MSKFCKKPVEIEAEQLTYANYDVLAEWCGGHAYTLANNDSVYIDIQTLEGVMTARLGDWIIRGIKGEFYPCKPDIFEATYEALGADR